MQIQYYKKNVIGTDYIVGDIHGCFVELQEELDKLGFNPETDRLFCVGDLVDRGPNSLDALEWLKKDWFKPARGNHEQMAIDFGTYTGMDPHTYEYNGGKWFVDLNDCKKAEVKFAFNELPFMIELEANIGKIGIIHAEVPGGDWELAKNMEVYAGKPTEAFANVALWARDRVRYNVTTNIKNIDYVIVGHTPMKQMKVLGNVIYIDTGACFKGKFTILRANDLFDMTP